MARHWSEYADRKYLEITGPAHIVCWGEQTSLCGVTAGDADWYGTGDWDEREHAAWLTLCKDCGLKVHPYLKPITDPDDASEDPAVEMWRQGTST